MSRVTIVIEDREEESADARAFPVAITIEFEPALERLSTSALTAAQRCALDFIQHMRSTDSLHEYDDDAC